MQRIIQAGDYQLYNGLTVLLLMAEQHVVYQSILQELYPGPLMNSHSFVYLVMKTLVLQAAQLLNMPLLFSSAKGVTGRM